MSLPLYPAICRLGTNSISKKARIMGGEARSATTMAPGLTNSNINRRNINNIINNEGRDLHGQPNSSSCSSSSSRTGSRVPSCPTPPPP